MIVHGLIERWGGERLKSLLRTPDKRTTASRYYELKRERLKSLLRT
ncbi:MAG: hypothetical protein ACRC8Y_04885 [Chroococcales cyanobacterium]